MYELVRRHCSPVSQQTPWQGQEGPSKVLLCLQQTAGTWLHFEVNTIPFNRIKEPGSTLNTLTKRCLSPHNEDATCRYHLSQALTVAPVGWSHVQWCKSLPFFNHMFSITLRVHRTNLSCNSMRTQRGRSGGWGSPALSCDSWVAGVSLGPMSTQWLLCTCQSSCDTDSLLGDASRGEWGERSSTKGQSPSSRWLPPAVFERKKKKKAHNDKTKGRASGSFNATAQCVRKYTL